MVVAPSLIPMKAGDRIKTDRRDAVMLAKLHRAGELTAVWVPDAAHEAMRDLIRARATAVRVLGKARQHLQGFLLRHGRVYAGKKGWTLPYRRWLTTVRFDHPAQQVVLQDYIHSVHDADERIARLTKQIEDLVPTWSMAPVVEAFQAMRGVAFVAAVTVVAEVGDFTRFDNPRQVMAYLGLTPSEHSSGTATRRGGITKAGNGLARLSQSSASFVIRSHVKPSFWLRRRSARRLDRRGLDLSNAGPRQPQAARPARGTSTDRPRHRLESASQALRSLPSARGDRQAQGRRDDRNRTGDGGISLGDCTPDADRFPRLILRR